MSEWRVITGDCLEVLPTLTERIDAVVTDPPYGMENDGDTTRFSGGEMGAARYGYGDKRGQIVGDDKPFDPTPWLEFPKVVLFGCNHFASRLPVGTTLVWIKKLDHLFGTFLSDCELAWMKGGCGVYSMRHDWSGFNRIATDGPSVHQNQKPVSVMRWAMDRAGVPVGATVLDPFCGSGTTGVACVQTGRNFIGIEIDPKYADIARRRIADAVPLFAQKPEPKPEQTEMFGGAA